MRVLFTVAVVVLAVSSLADTWAPPVPRIFASPSGKYGIKVVPPTKDGSRADAVVFTLDARGNEKALWRARLVNVPYQVFVTDAGRVITLDTYARIGYEHAVVIYGDDGRVRADYELEQLLTSAEITKLPTTVASRWWNQERLVDWVAEGDWTEKRINLQTVQRASTDQMLILLPKLKKTLTFDLVTARYIR
jgi:hypothetical protein